MGSGRWNEVRLTGASPEGDKDLKGKIVESLSAASELTSTLLLLQRPFTGRGLFGLGLQTASIVSRLHQIWTRPPNIDVAHAFKDWVVLDSNFQMFALGGLRLVGTIDPDWVSVYRGAIFNAAYHAEVEGVQLGYVSNRSLVEVPHNEQEATAMTAGTSLVPLYCKKLSDLRPLIHKRFWASAPNTGLLRITTGNKREEITLPTTFRETARLQQLVSTARSFVEAKIPWCFLLDGEPGTGKSSAALHATHRLGLRAVVLEANHIAQLPDSVEDSILYKVTDIIQPDVLIISDIDRLSNEDQLILLELLDYARRWVKLIFLTSNHSERLLDAVERAERIDETFPIGGLEQEEIVALVQMMPEHVRTRISTEFIAQMNGWPIVYVLNLLKRVEAQLTIGPMTDDELNAVFTKVVERRNAAHTKWLEQREHPSRE